MRDPFNTSDLWSRTLLLSLFGTLLHFFLLLVIRARARACVCVCDKISVSVGLCKHSRILRDGAP